MFKKSYDNLTAIERDNVAKRKVMEYAKQRMEGQITQGYENQDIENAGNAELESKKRLFQKSLMLIIYHLTKYMTISIIYQAEEKKEK